MASKKKKEDKAKKTTKVKEPYRQKSIEELHAAALTESAATGKRNGPAYQAWIDALEAQAALAPVGAMIEEEARDQTWIPETDKAAVEAEEQEEAEAEKEAEKEERKKKKKPKQPKKKVVEQEEEEEEKPKRKRKSKSTKTMEVPKADAAIISAIDKGEKEKQKNEGQVVRTHIKKDLMWPTSLEIHLDRLFTPHWMWRDRDLTHRHVERIKNEILKTPGKFFKTPIVQPVRLA